ncbi:hypothetical protein RUM43_008473 [Polyplax serrata]|uniref:Peroxisomal ATPase PEX1 n=1 Tax=Polyplax serrata TaxID=468196 RepID=A0AAN8NN08_POLSC
MDYVQAIKLEFGYEYSRTTFGSLYLQPHSDVPDKCIGVSCLFATRLGLKENDTILISNVSPPAVEAVQIIPRREEDYVVLLSCKGIIENNLLNQVRVIAEGQILPIYVFSNILIDVEIGKLKPDTGCGQLQRFTEVTIIHPSEKSGHIGMETYSSVETKDNFRIKGNIMNFIADINIKLQRNSSSNDSFNRSFASHVIKFNKTIRNKYIVWPVSLLPDEQYKKSLENCIVIMDSRRLFCGNTKLCKVWRKACNAKPLDLKDNEEVLDSEDNANFVYTNAINFNSCNESVEKRVFCSTHIMKKLNIFVGSELLIENVKCDVHKKFENNKIEQMTTKGETLLWNSMSDIKKNIFQSVLNNIAFKLKINTLIIGEEGTGKTFLLNALIEDFRNEFIDHRKINCKSLQGKKLETLNKVLLETMTSCCQGAAVLILDDLHALTKFQEDENQFNKLNSKRIVELLTKHIQEFQEKFNMTVVATTTALTELSDLVSIHGPRLFQNIEKIVEMTSEDRHFVLKNILLPKNTNLEFIKLKKVTETTNGYTIQDLKDLINKAMFNSLKRGNGLTFEQTDIDLALAHSVPQLTKEGNVKERAQVPMDLVGGMNHAKEVLMEVFSWPSKYPNLLQSCPLRLQRGVLLYGVPGTGKTLLASALAHKCGLNFLSVKGPEVLSKYVGASEEGIRNLFYQAQRSQPCLLFFDEFDSLAPKRGHDSTGVIDRVVNQLLTQLDGVEALNGVWVLAATSRPDLLDPALLRPGRLDKLVFCDFPKKIDRLSILKSLSQNMSVTADVDFEEVADKADGYTGADLQAILYNAQMLAIKERREDVATDVMVHQRHLMSALCDTKPSLTKSEKVKYREIYQKFVTSRKKNTGQEYSNMKQKVTVA